MLKACLYHLVNVPLINPWEAVPATSPFHSVDLPLERKGN